MVKKFEWICGVDEAGRGPLAGPVFAACVVLDPDYQIAGLTDSKKLSEKKRDDLTLIIKTRSIAWAIAFASVEEIDQLNILQASLLAMKRAVESLSFVPNKVLVDGNRSPCLDFPTEAIIGGDNLVPEISAASILAKTARDAEMLRLHHCFPNYGFDQHKGYPTKGHISALQKHGPSVVHRRSFSPVKKLVERIIDKL
ncbi:MAG: ribonuclease HII [Nitrosospira sp.]|nr:ribonuclease HII [Nitrosospira sp.]MBI0407197.1 ribonuclease HII [Nitrosospira sp.]MBI0415160.1 ribonuclease HII [Nitrosospira sp.]MBI0416744.1 ribonuclease HII [Nitrosospira sp.]MBI0417589.1 ribonuclease HII [Nitrosospira sp.]